MVLLSTRPSVRTPVTFGGGMTIENAGLLDLASAPNASASSQRLDHFRSTVFDAVRQLLHSEDILDLGDTARVPYGNKGAETVEPYGLELAKMLIAENAKLIVVACNAVSSVAIPKLRANVPVPVIGVIEPGANAAIAMTRNRHVGVIGKPATGRSGACENGLRALNVHGRV